MTDFAPLVDQAKYAEDSIDKERTASILRLARYAGVREMTNKRGDRFTMFAVAIPRGEHEQASKDIILCRTPELAKFIAMLLTTGEELVIEAMKKDGVRVPSL